MDFERVSLLLGIVHNSLNIPGTERLRDEAIKELQELNGKFASAPVVEPVAEVVAEVAEPEPEPVQEEIKMEGRRI